MAISPWYQGNTGKVWQLQCIPDSGSYDFTGLSTSSFSLTFRNNDTGVETTGTGTFSNVTNAVVTGTAPYQVVTSPATVYYQVSSGDVAILGNYELLLTITFSDGPLTLDLGKWQVIPR